MRRMVVHVCLLLALYAVGVNSQCLGFNFFPNPSQFPADELPQNCTTGAGGCARPSVWLQSSQDSTGLTPERPDSELYKVALPEDNGVETPHVFWLPVSPLLGGGDASACVNKDLLAPQKARRMRRLQATAEPRWTATAAAIQPLSYKVNVKLTGADGSTKKTYQQIGPIISSGGMPYELGTTSARLPEGEYCWVLEATATIDPKEITNEGGQTLEAYAAGNSLSLPGQAKGVRKVCFYKRAEQATATIKYGMCRTGKFELNITNITPLAQNLTLNGEPVPGKYLFQPMLKIWGGKVRNLDGSEAPQEYDQNNQKLNYVAKYYLLPTNYTPDAVVNYQVADDLDEGYYQINVVVSMLTDFPKLVALNGVTKINQTDATGEEVQDKYEALAFQVTNGSEVGVQYSPTRLSEIKASAVDRTIQTGSTIKLEWTFNGVGKSTTCTHDGVPVPYCKSPVTLKANAITTEDTKHTFTVTFTDVCGRVKTANFSYTEKGVVTETKKDPPSPPKGSLAAAAAAKEEQGKNAGSHSAPSRLLSLGLGGMAFAAACLW